MTPKRLLYWCLWGIIIGLIIPLYSRFALDDPVDYVRGGVGAGDFKAYYVAARLMARGENIYSVQLQEAELTRLGLPIDDVLYIYPALLATVLMPLSAMPLQDAARVWNLVNLVALGASVLLVTRALGLRQLLREHYPWLILLFALADPTKTALRIGQANILVLFLLALALDASRGGVDRAAGVALALAGLLKLFPLALVGWFLWQRRLRLAAWAVGTLAALLATNALLLAANGLVWTLDFHYATNVIWNLSPRLHLDNQSLGGFFGRFGLPPFAWSVMTLTSCLAVLAATGLSLTRIHTDDKDALGYSAALIALVLVSSITWTTTLVLMLIPFAALLKAIGGIRRSSVPLYVMGVAYLLMSGARLVESNHRELLTWWTAVPFLGCLLLWMLVLWQIHQAERVVSPSPVT